MRDYVMNYEEAVELLCRIPRFTSNRSLSEIQKLLTKMGQPDRYMKIVHVAGTNGKGSTCAYLAGMLEKSGLKVGLFTSPHLVDVRERFRIRGEMISKELFTEAVEAVLTLLEQTDSGTPCYFDMIFLVGMYAFWKERVDILILETGLGGRFDATNAVSEKTLTLITHIALDHTEYLGDTLEAIAAEKSGIMRTSVPCIVAPHNDSVSHIFLKKADEIDSPCRILGKEDYSCHGVYEKSVAFSYFSRYYGTVPVRLNTLAAYQADNVSLAIAGLESLIEQGIIDTEALSAKSLQESLYATSWEGRMEEVRPGVFLDGAHNLDGVAAFLNSVSQYPCDGQRLLIFSAVSDKNYPQMLADILESRLFGQIIVTHIDGERGVAAEELYESVLEADSTMPSLCMPDLSDALEYVFTKRQQSDHIYIVGSLYLVGQTRRILSNHLEFSAKEEGEPV